MRAMVWTFVTVLLLTSVVYGLDLSLNHTELGASLGASADGASGRVERDGDGAGAGAGGDAPSWYAR